MIDPRYEVAPCGCVGFFHSTGCSDQNVLDPFGFIIDSISRERVRKSACQPNGVALIARSHPPDTLIAKEMAFEAALIDLAEATDGAGLAVNLMPHTNSVEELRRSTHNFACNRFCDAGLGPDAIDFDGKPISPPTPASRAAYFRNLALLANATAAAIEYESHGQHP